MSEELKPLTAADSGFDADEPNIKGIFLFMVLMIGLFIAVVIGVTYYYNYVFEQTEERQLLDPPSEQLAELHAREKAELTHYSYADKAKGQVRIPVARAMELIEREAAAGKLRYPQADQAPKKPEPVAAPAASEK
jgi:hypothetical protein